jgi:flagellar biosynthesis/type III secretory pathway protein FliH
MVQVLGTGVEAESVQVYEEGRSILGSLVNRFIAIVHRIVDEILKVTRQIITYASEHPLATVLLTANIMIWVSP